MERRAQSSFVTNASDSATDSASKSGSGSGSGSGSESDSSSGSSSESDAELRLVRPIFLKKKGQPKAGPKHDSAKTVLAKAEHIQNVDAKTVEKVPFDGVDDTDDIDPEAEYRQWQLREGERKRRDKGLVAETEAEKEDAVRRKRGLLREGDADEEHQKHQDSTVPVDNGALKSSKLGGFYADGLDEKFLKRDYKDLEDNEDHSRPTKYKRA